LIFRWRPPEKNPELIDRWLDQLRRQNADVADLDVAQKEVTLCAKMIEEEAPEQVLVNLLYALREVFLVKNFIIREAE
jgi:hypothetical protein